jgi:hypothetical protein
MPTVLDCMEPGGGKAPGSGSNIAVGAGRIRAVLVSHLEVDAQTIGFYDTADPNTDPGTLVLNLILNPSLAPYYLRFAKGDEPRFTNGLDLSGTPCKVWVWVVVRD